MPRILWLQSGAKAEEVELFEKHTGLQVRVSDGAPGTWQDLVQRVRLVVIGLPLPSEVVQETLIEAHQATVPVVVYDPEAELDEGLIRPPITAFRHLTDRLTTTELAAVVDHELERAAQRAEQASQDREPWRNLLIGESRPMKLLHSTIRLAAPRRATVLITGETGTGKEMVARAIHMASSRAGSRMVSVNCAAIPENLVESELFGHVKGAFTGAMNDRAGRFELAHRGTIFLDEIAEVPYDVQAKLLRVLQERELQRVGGTTDVQVDARVIAASNRDLEQGVRDKHFREDLLYRLNVVPIVVPPLRERASDIPLLAEHFIEKICVREGVRAKTLSADAVRRLTHHEWPGNVRQLEHAIEMAIILSGDRTRLYAGDLRITERPAATAPSVSLPAATPQGGGISLEKMVGRVEQVLIQEALQQCGGNKAKAASSLGIPRTTLMYKLRNIGVCA